MRVVHNNAACLSVYRVLEHRASSVPPDFGFKRCFQLVFPDLLLCPCDEREGRLVVLERCHKGRLGKFRQGKTALHAQTGVGKHVLWLGCGKHSLFDTVVFPGVWSF